MTDEHGIVVTGRGSVASVPDTVVVTLGVSVHASTAPEAIGRAAQASGALMAALRTAGVAESDVSTSHYGIHQEYRHTDAGSTPDGYRVINTVNAVVRDVGETGSVIDAAAAAAGEAIEVQGIVFGLSDDRAARAAAREAAFADAVAAATQLAGLAGLPLGKASWIHEFQAFDGPGPGVMKALAAGAATPVSGGELTTSVQVEVRFEFAPRR
ncbi:MAG: SIMPL domain-containing protein [Actinobacteria bacterium]|nr:SIMPL domain-containing protein [Actinomycetota bacterium]